MKKLAVIDADMVAHRCAAAGDKRIYSLRSVSGITANKQKEILEIGLSLGMTPAEVRADTELVIEPQSEEFVLQLIDTYLSDIFKAIGTNEYLAYLSCSSEEGYRRQIYDKYKLNRATTTPPTHLGVSKRYLTTCYNTRVCQKIEADDALGIVASGIESGCLPWGGDYEIIIITNDKDLQQIQNTSIFNPVTKDFVTKTQEEALLFTYEQILTGDASDGIKGIKGVGKKVATNILKPVREEKDYFLSTLLAYLEREVKALAKDYSLSEDNKEENLVLQQMALFDMYLYANMVYILRYRGANGADHGFPFITHLSAVFSSLSKIGKDVSKILHDDAANIMTDNNAMISKVVENEFDAGLFSD